MQQFYELSPYLQDDKFCLTTVDTIFREEEFSTFIETFKQSETDGYMAVTDFIDDEKPLYISTDSALDITGFPMMRRLPNAVIYLEHLLSDPGSR